MAQQVQLGQLMMFKQNAWLAMFAAILVVQVAPQSAQFVCLINNITNNRKLAELDLANLLFN